VKTDIYNVFAVIKIFFIFFVKWREDQAHTSLLATISSCLSFVFVAEVSMKMIAFTPHGYWQSRRNRYDTLVTVMGLVWAITNYTMGVIASFTF
jgi:hypothetical protein